MMAPVAGVSIVGHRPVLTTHYDVVVIGAGAAGMMCAARAGQRGRRVLLVEHYDVVGEKIRISGGGRCNFTNLNAGPASYLSQNPHFCRSALARYTPAHFTGLVERYGIAYHEKKLGQLFCDRSARDIIAMLQAECALGGVRWWMPCSVQRVTREDTGFGISTSMGHVACASLVIATGGLTVPKIGATPFAYQIAAQFGLGVVPPRPALVPLALPPDFPLQFGLLSGVSADVEITCGTARFRENLLFTHRGLSGPATLQASSYWSHRTPLVINLLPDVDATRWLDEHAASPALLDHLLAERLPARLARQWCLAHGVDVPVRTLSDARRHAVGASLNAWNVHPSGTLGYDKAEVTLGGVDTRGLSSKTMAAISVPGLHFVGEAVDVTGWLGGYNFLGAWETGQGGGLVA
jgi:predicted Rossmann fold flavoprotein